MPKIFTMADDDFIRAHWHDMSKRDLAAHLGRDMREVYTRAVYVLGMPKVRMGKAAFSEGDDRFIRDAIRVATYAEIARKLQRTEREIAERARYLGLGRRKR